MAAITSLSLTIGGSTVDLAASHVALNEAQIFDRDQPGRLTFTKFSVLPDTDAWANEVVTLRINGSVAFHGLINRPPELAHSDETGYTYLYEARSMDFAGDDWPVVSPFDGTGSIRFNGDPEDPLYDPTYAGLSLGEMIRVVLETPSTAEYLSTFGVGRYDSTTVPGTWTLDARTIADLEAGYLGSYNPPQAVTISGDNLFQTIRGLLQSAAPNIRLWFQVVEEPPNGEPLEDDEIFTVIRFSDLRTVSSTKTFTFGTDPGPAPQLRPDTSNSFSRVVVRGGPDIRPVILDLSEGDLSEAFAMPPWLATNTDAKAAWTLDTWLRPENQQIKGTCLCRRPRTTAEADPMDPSYIADPTDVLLADPNWLLVDPEDNDLTWSEDDYAQDSGSLAGFLYISREPATDWVDMLNRRVTSNTALTAGGTAYLQLDASLPGTDFTAFTMVPGIWPGSLTWRRYAIEKLTAEGKSIAKYAQPLFPKPVPWMHTDGTTLSWSIAGVATVFWSEDDEPPYQWQQIGYQIDRLNEAVIFDRPVVTLFGQPESLETGGVDVDGQPSNIKVLIPVATAPLEAIQPEDDPGPQFEGTSNTVDGIERTLYVNFLEWTNEADTGPMTLWARQILDSVKDTVIEGSVIRYDYDPVLRPDVAISLDAACHSTSPWVNRTSMIASCLIKFNPDGPIPYHTEYAVSNRRDQYRGFDPDTHPHRLDPPRELPFRFAGPGSLISRGRDEVTGGNTDLVRKLTGRF